MYYNRLPYAVLTLRALEVYRHERTQVALGVLVRIEVAGEAANGQIVNRSNVLLISWILTLAGHPDCVELNECIWIIIMAYKKRYASTTLWGSVFSMPAM